MSHLLDKELHAAIKKAVAMFRQCGATAVYVFGSVLKGPLRLDSDIDIAVKGLPAWLFFRAMADASRIIGRPVDLVMLDRDDAVSRSLLASGELLRVD